MNLDPKWDNVIFYGGMFMFFFNALVVLLWAIAKSFGWINTPIWLQMIPLIATVFGIIGGVIGFSIKLGRFLERFGMVESDLGSMKAELHEVKENLHRHDKRLMRIESHLHAY